jgi:polyferredoxin
MLRHVLRPRIIVYSLILALIVGGFITSLALRDPFRVDVVRDRGVLARMVGEGMIENVYRLQVMNATEQVQRYSVRVAGLPGSVLVSKPDFEVEPTEARWVAVTVQIPPEAAAALGEGAHPVRFEVERKPEPGEKSVTLSEKSTFVVPR